MPLVRLSYFLLHLISSVLYTEGKLVNITIDDTNGDPTTGEHFTYLGSAWNVGQNCTGCADRPDPLLVLDGTWHDATFNVQSTEMLEPNIPLNASVAFNGATLYVYCITDAAREHSYMTFYIDNELVGSYIQNKFEIVPFEYNVLVYQNQSINPGPHNFTLSNGKVNGAKALVLLDYVVYTSV
ncbi:hypothetical protein OBBRIDRAFT_741653 [Obba rivulosa]|uniref:Uncharacterized protein n=1 Tax=Obba rivulosa TaxID=1052685 RepID=A0A8E2ALF6_9APHY|nr:hypothetical protein OBBRIDRAFT_741653 [Obba rivulosa]